MEIKIKQGVPIPTDIKRKARYPFKDMKPGEMFFLPDKAKRNTVDNAARRYSADHPEYKFVVGYYTEDEVEGVGVWRTNDEANPAAEIAQEPQVKEETKSF